MWGQVGAVTNGALARADRSDAQSSAPARFVGRISRAPGPPRRTSPRRRRNLVNRQIGAVVLVFLIEPQPDRQPDRTVHECAAERRHDDSAQRAHQLRAERNAAQAAERAQAEDACRDTTPRAAQTVQRPYAQYVVDAPAVLHAG